MAVTNTDLVSLRVFPELWRLLDLREGGHWCFQPVLLNSQLKLVTGARVWLGGWSDAIAIRDLKDAKGFRCDPEGWTVWNREGGLMDVLDGLLELPAPGERNAPRLVKASSRAVDHSVRRWDHRSGLRRERLAGWRIHRMPWSDWSVLARSGSS